MTEKVNKAKAATVRTKNVKQEPQYFTGELIENAEKVFGKGVSRDCVAAALKIKNITKTSISNAKKIVNDFRKEEVS